MRYQWIKKHRRSYSLALMCRKLQVSTSGFYDWSDRQPSQRQQRRDTITQAAARSYFESHRIYGYRKVVATTDSNHSQPVAENLLERDFTAPAPNQKWLTDITYISTQEGWLYLAAVLDVFSRKVVGWSMSERIDTELVKSALQMATTQRSPEPGLLHHSDRGVQYASDAYQDYQTREEAKQDLFKYIELFYNRQRRHAALGYISPAEFERRYEVTQDQAA